MSCASSCVGGSHRSLQVGSLASPHNHDSRQGQWKCKKRSRYQCNVYRRRHHTRGGRCRQTLAQKPSRANFTYTSPLRLSTSTDHDYVHAETLQTTTHVRIASIIACRNSRFSTRRLRHRLHTHDGRATPAVKRRRET